MRASRKRVLSMKARPAHVALRQASSRRADRGQNIAPSSISSSTEAACANRRTWWPAALSRHRITRPVALSSQGREWSLSSQPFLQTGRRRRIGTIPASTGEKRCSFEEDDPRSSFDGGLRRGAFVLGDGAFTLLSSSVSVSAAAPKRTRRFRNDACAYAGPGHPRRRQARDGPRSSHSRSAIAARKDDRAVVAVLRGLAHRLPCGGNPIFSATSPAVCAWKLATASSIARHWLQRRLSGPKPIKVDARHAGLAVNPAGSAALFLVETWNDTR